jgi:UDP:flavonoid glycosyltransferase YjiC (YdhE family)
MAYNSAGIPQVVLPVWMDTFDFARRAELLGIGRWGNKISRRTKPWGGELGNAMVDVVLSPQSPQMKAKAQELAQLCDRDGGGRVIAAKIILKEGREYAIKEKGESVLTQSSSLD